MYTWDNITIYQTANRIDNYGLELANHATQLESVIADAADASSIYTWLRERCPEARYFWYEICAVPVGAYGTTGDTSIYGYIYGDTCTDEVFAGWPELAEGETVQTSITFGENTRWYDSAVKRVAAVSYLAGGTEAQLTEAEAQEIQYPASGAAGVADIRPIDVEASIIIDGEYTSL